MKMWLTYTGLLSHNHEAKGGDTKLTLGLSDNGNEYTVNMYVDGMVTMTCNHVDYVLAKLHYLELCMSYNLKSVEDGYY